MLSAASIGSGTGAASAAGAPSVVAGGSSLVPFAGAAGFTEQAFSPDRRRGVPQVETPSRGRTTQMNNAHPPTVRTIFSTSDQVMVTSGR